MARLAPQGPFRQFTNDGVPLAGGKLFTYESGTVTPKATYTSADESSANTNPVILDANGRANVWLDAGSYTWVLKTSADVTLWSQDDISAESPSAFGASISTVSSNLSVSEAYANALIVCTATLTLSLLAAATAEEGFYFIVKNTGTGVVTIDPSGSETIDGVATITVLRNESAVIFCTGSNWISVLKSPVPFVPASSTTSAYLDFAEDTDNGANRARVIAPAALAADADITLPGVTGTLATLAGTETLINKTATNIVLNGTLTGTAIKDEDAMSSDSNTAVPTQQSVKAYVDARTALGTAISTTSGTTHDFTGIPSGVRNISVMFRGVSVNSTSNFLIQIGAGSITSSGYLSSADYGGASATSTAGFIVRNSSAAEAHSGIIVINAIGSNAWVSSHNMRPNNGTGTSGAGIGDVALGGTLDRVRITTVGGDVFDAGTVNIRWEF